MKALFHKKVQKFLRKKKNKHLLSLIQHYVDEIIAHPEKGDILEHPFRKYRIRSFHFSVQGTEYRIAYIVNNDAEEIVFLLIDSRENFYEKLRRVEVIKN